MKPKKNFGKAFSDQIGRVNTKHRHINHKNINEDWTDSFIVGPEELNQTEITNPWRRLLFAIAVLITFTVFGVRLMQLQIIEGKENRELADSNRIQIKVIHAPRGVIYDRNSKILAQNEPGFRLIEMSEKGEKKARIISREEFLQMEVRQDSRLKDLEVDSVRNYTYGEKTSHLLGYVSEITEDELKSSKYENYQLGDKVGRGGVEETYEKILKGVDGGEIIEVDAAGKKIRTLRKKDAVPGQNLYLTIDLPLQLDAFDKLKKGVEDGKSCCGALIAQDPNNGQILALVSYPSFDPKKISEALVSPNSPMLNRVIGGIYPPASTFKIATSLAALKSGKVTPETSFVDTGIMNLGPFTFANWYFTQYGRKEDTPVDMVKALARSNDIYYYQVGRLIGEDEIGKMSKSLGFGSPVGIDIPGEVSGLVPNNAWKVKQFNEVWYPGDTLHMAIGQGFMLTTPIQISNMISFVASNGKQYPPHLALKITDSHDKVIKEYNYDPLNNSKFKMSDLETIKKGLEAVTSNGGTAWPLFNFPIRTAGKTGTAEYGDLKKTHAWYTGYAPTDDPKIAVTTLIEGGGEGSSNASPVVREVFRYFFSPDKKNLIKDISPIASDSAIRTLGE